MAIKFLSSENIAGDIDVTLSKNGITYLAVTNTDNGASANARVQVVGESSQLDLIATSAGYTGVTGWADSGIVSTDSGASGGLKLNSQAGGIQLQSSTTSYVIMDASGYLGVNMTPDTSVRLSVSGAIGPTNGTEGAPTHTFYGDPNTGMFRSGADTLGFSTGGTTRLSVRAAGIDVVGETETDTALVTDKLGIGAINNSFNLYNNGTTYLNGDTTVDATFTVSNTATTSSVSTQFMYGKRTNSSDGPIGEIIYSNNGDSVATLAGFRDGADDKGSLVFQTQNGSAGFATRLTIAAPGDATFTNNLTFPDAGLSSSASATNFGVYTTEIRLIDTPNGGLKQCRVITDNYGEWVLVGRFAASAMTSIQGVWSSESGLDTSTSQSTTTKFSADFGDSYPTEVRIMGSTDFTKWRDNRTIDFIYGVPEGRAWKYFFSGGAANGMTSVGPNHSGNNKFGWNINGSYDGFGRWVNPAQTSVGMSDTNVTNPSAAYTTATNNAFNWHSASDAKMTVSATRTFSGQDSFETAGFGKDDAIQGFFDEYPNETNNMQGGVDFSSSVWVLIKLPTAISSGSGGGSGNQWAGGPTTIHNTNTGSVGIGTSNPGVTGKGLEIQNIGNDTTASLKLTGHNNTGTPGAATSTELKHIGDSLKFAINHAGTDALTIGSSASTIGFTLANTTELGTYPQGAVKRIRMAQGGEIHFGDTTTAAPLGITEGAWDNFGDQDRLSIYARNDFSVYSYGGASPLTTPKLHIDDANSYFQGSNFGIGTTSPDHPLEVVGVISSADSGLQKSTFANVGNDLVLTANADATNVTANILFKSSGSGGGAVSEKMRIASTGAVGIDNSSPDSFNGSGTTSSSLVIGKGTSSSSPQLTLWQGNSAQATINFASANTGAGQYEGRIRYTRDTGVMDFRTNGVANVLVLTSSGNVGINDTSAPNRLSVSDSGNLVCRFTGGTTFSLIQNNTDSSVIFSANHGNASPTGVEKRFIWQMAGGTAKMKLDDGTLTVSADLIAYGSPSDKRLKENIKPIESALDKVEKLQGVTFDWKDKKQDKAYDPDQNWKHDIGFIAQDVQKVIPELVRENKDGMLSMRHQGMAPILLEAIKELKAEVEELKKQIKQ